MREVDGEFIGSVGRVVYTETVRADGLEAGKVVEPDSFVL